jgi:hypothetical protein
MFECKPFVDFNMLTTMKRQSRVNAVGRGRTNPRIALEAVTLLGWSSPSSSRRMSKARSAGRAPAAATSGSSALGDGPRERRPLKQRAPCSAAFDATLPLRTNPTATGTAPARTIAADTSAEGPPAHGKVK